MHVIDQHDTAAEGLASKSHTCPEAQRVMGGMGDEDHGSAGLAFNVKILLTVLCNYNRF